MRFAHDLNAVRDVLPGRKDITGTVVRVADAVTAADHAEFDSIASCTVDAFFDLLGDLAQVRMACNDFAEGIGNTDDRTSEVIIIETAAL